MGVKRRWIDWLQEHRDRRCRSVGYSFCTTLPKSKSLRVDVSLGPMLKGAQAGICERWCSRGRTLPGRCPARDLESRAVTAEVPRNPHATVPIAASVRLSCFHYLLSAFASLPLHSRRAPFASRPIRHPVASREQMSSTDVAILAATGL